jgi:lysyl-tRNA synthetase, class II
VLCVVVPAMSDANDSINALRASKDPNPYPHKFHTNTRIHDFVEQHKGLTRGEELKDGPEIRIGLRVMAIRSSSSSLRFYVGKAEGVTIQVMCQLQNAKGDVSFEKQHENIQRGGMQLPNPPSTPILTCETDIIGVVGYAGRTAPKKGGDGELSVFAQEVILLTPCLRMLPTEHL